MLMYRHIARSRLRDLNHHPDQDQGLRRAVNPIIADIATDQEASQMRTAIEIRDMRDVAITRAGTGMTRMEKAIVKRIKTHRCTLQLSTHDQDPIHRRGKAHIEVVMTRKRNDATHIDIEIPTDPTVTEAETAARKAAVGAEDLDHPKILMGLNLRDLTRRRRMVMPEERPTRIDEDPKSPILAGTTTGSTLVESGLNPLLKTKPKPKSTNGVATIGYLSVKAKLMA
jgi:hypothetical protein